MGTVAQPGSRCSASVRTVGELKRVARGKSIPAHLRMRTKSRTARSEFPPNSKKLSLTPTRSTPSTSAQNSASDCSTEVRGATYVASSSGRVCSGAGRARRSTLPFGESGNFSSITKAFGTMYSGNFSFKYWRNTLTEGVCSPSGIM